MLLDGPNILLTLVAVMNFILGGLIYIKHRKILANQIYALNIILIIWWIAMMVIYRGLSSAENLALWTRVLYAVPTTIASTFLYFSFFFPNEEVRKHLYYLLGIICCNIAIVWVTLTPGLVIEGVSYVQNGENIITFGPLYWPFALYILSFFSLGIAVLGRKFFVLDDVSKKRQLAYLLVGYLIASTLALVTNLILPWFGYFEVDWMGQVLTVFMVFPVTYAIFRHGLFAGKVIATELLVTSLWIFQLVQVLIADSPSQQLVNGILLTILVITGLILIRSVNKEVEAREKIESLAKDLEKANARLKELDRQKTEFVSIASHQLRSPLTAIKGYSSLLLEGSYGKLSKAAEQSIKKIFDSSKYMAISIEDFLNVSRIELGTVKYDMKDFSLATLGEEVVGELLPAAGEKGLALVFHDASSGKALVRGDYGKLRQVVLNLVDNAMKYTPKGGITVTVAADETKHVAQLSIADTGVGIPSEVMPKLFGKFVRAKNANEVNVMGTGLGLFVAKQFVEAHHGRIWAESLGQGKGSTFRVELPLAQSR